MEAKHDVLVVGAGLAGMRAAVEAFDAGADVALISKIHPVRSHSVAAQGGINAALGEQDSWEAHAFDTTKGGLYLGDQDAIEAMCREAPDEILELERLGVIFSRDEQGRIAQRPFGGAGFPRTCYAADRTGHAILHAMYEQLLKRRIAVYEEWYVTSLITEERIETTVTKAKAMRPHVEKMITLGKRGDLSARRQAGSYLMTGDALSRLFDTVAQRFGDRNGGYLRIVRTGFRKGDGGETAFVELIGGEKFVEKKRQKSAEARSKKMEAAKKQMEEAEKSAEAENEKEEK